MTLAHSHAKDDARPRIRVGFVAFLPVADRGGQINILRLVDGLDRERFTPIVFAPEEGPLAEHARKSGADVEIIEIPPLIVRTPRDLFLLPSRRAKLAAVTRTFERLRLDIIYVDAAYHVRAVAHAARSIGADVVWHAQVGAPSRHDRLAAAAASVIATVSESAEALLDGVGVAPIRIPGAVDTRRFHAAPEPTLRAERGLPEGEPVLLFVGGLEAQKGTFELIEAFGRLKSRGVSARLQLVGRGDRAPLERRATELGVDDRIDWVGSRTDVERFYRAADLFVFPSRTEGLPLAVLEAMASGLPCIATDIPGVHGLLAGGAGVLVPLGDIAALADAIADALAHAEARAEMAARALTRALEHHRVEGFIAAFDRLFTTIAERKNAKVVSSAATAGGATAGDTGMHG